MRAAAIDRFGPPSALKIHELPLPRVGVREVLIAVDTAGVGSWEPEQRSGEWGVENARFPLVLGSDGSGTVVARGKSVRRLRVGDRVYAYVLGRSKSGCDAEYVAAPATHVARIPRGLDLKHAGALPAIGLTAVQGVDDAIHVKRHERVVIVGASGNVGMLALQFAKRRGARVLAVASGRDGVAFVRRLGADAAVDGKHGDLEGALRRFAPDGVDVVLGFAGGKVLTTCIDAVREGGRVAYPHGIEPEPRKRRGIKFVGYDAEGGVREFAHLNRAIEHAAIEVPIAREFPLERAAEAHRLLEKGHVLGRIVLRAESR
jgi:NADPH:quinone reductase-like Zn-dependent oxidoreductase